MNSDFVFLDPTGRRWTWSRRIGVLLFLFLTVILALLLHSIWKPVPLPPPESLRTLKSQFRALDKIEPPNFPSRSLPPPLTAQNQKGLNRLSRLRTQFNTPDRTSSGEIRLGYYVNWDPYSYDSLLAHADQLTHVVPEWFTVTDIQARIHVEPDFKLLGTAAAKGLAVVPLMTNLRGNQWCPEPIEALAFGPASRREAFFKELRLQLHALRAPAVLVNFEQLDPTYKPEITRFYREMQTALRQDGRGLWLSIPVGEDLKAYDLEALSLFVDRFVAVLHDENGEFDEPGPLASQDWFEGWLSALLAYGKPSQWIVALGNYGYEWQKGGTRGETLRFVDVMTRADHAQIRNISSQEPLYNPSFGYREKDQVHTVWFLDAITFANQWRAAHESGVGGWALQRLGTEDPTLWQLAVRGPDALGDHDVRHSMERIAGDSFHANVGEGEFLAVDMEHGDGHRDIRSDKDGRFTARYTDTPDYATIYHQGEGTTHEVALTFDDGPDPEWTPKILDLLKAHQAKAAFFLLGRNAENNPGLVNRILAEGHEIGNHTYTHPNLALASAEQTRLELNATQRLLEAITGRSTTLFRPPYNADSRPHDPREIEVIRIAQEMGYLTVGENIDPEDWARPGADEIVNRVKHLRTEGSIILLHDAGGNRDQTLAALPRILDYLEARGDRIVPLSQLVGIPRDILMPPVDRVDSPPTRLLAEMGFQLWHYGNETLQALVLLATGFLFIRTGLVVVLAIKNRLRERHETSGHPQGAVSVLIAAYNEEKVIAQTLRSVLDTDYLGPLDIVVVDDGSKDGTAEQVETLARQDSRIRLMRQTNQGKSEALRHALRSSSHEWIVFLDADTQFQRDTIRELVTPFIDPRVVAVSGQARVGNQRGWLTRFQALEYLCGFNLDRRAYHEWNCITVVPGAVSALRRGAIDEIGGLSSDTLAEDTDMTLMLHRRGHRIAYAARAIAWTEAPETFRALAKQRFRWAFGTLQCLWKHRDLLFDPKQGAVGWFSLPSVWIFQIGLVALVPVVDMGLILSLLGTVKMEMVVFVVGFMLVDMLLALIATLLDRAPLRNVWRIVPMRFFYRPLLAWVVWRALFQALSGAWVGWGKLERTATVRRPTL